MRERAAIIDASPPDPRDHPAARAWREIPSEGAEPERIGTLKEAKLSAVYRLDGAGPAGSAVIAKRCRSATAVIERAIYQEVLADLPGLGLHCYGFVEERDREFCWLFLEDAGGEGYAPLDPQHRALATRWLGLVHASATRVPTAARLPDREPNHYRERLHTTRDILRDSLANPALKAGDRAILTAVVAQCELLAAKWGQVETWCAGMPRTLVHGDFATKNVRVRTGHPTVGLVPMDWETAGWGVPAVDLAQHTVGSVSPDLDVYGSVVRPTWPQLDLRDVRRMAEVGRIFRLIDAMSWASGYTPGEILQGAIKPMRLQEYEPMLAGAVRAAEWEG